MLNIGPKNKTKQNNYRIISEFFSNLWYKKQSVLWIGDCDITVAFFLSNIAWCSFSQTPHYKSSHPERADIKLISASTDFQGWNISIVSEVKLLHRDRSTFHRAGRTDISHKGTFVPNVFCRRFARRLTRHQRKNYSPAPGREQSCLWTGWWEAPRLIHSPRGSCLCFGLVMFVLMSCWWGWVILTGAPWRGSELQRKYP